MSTPTKRILLCLLFITIQTYSYSQQVGIGTTTPSNGSILDVSSTDKGVLLPRVALTGIDDTTTITPVATPGLLVYNTATSVPSAVQVTPGFYYWDGVAWRRFFNQGYTLRFRQRSQIRASNDPATAVILPDLGSGDLQVSFSGTYQIIVTALYSTGDINNSGADAGSQGSIALEQSINGGNFTRLKETYVSSSSRRIDGDNLNNLSQQITIIKNIELDASQTYNFRVVGREWARRNAQRGFFGRNTNNYDGNEGVNRGQRGSMTITLIRQN